MTSILYLLSFSSSKAVFFGALPKEKNASPGRISDALSIISFPSIFIEQGPIPNTSNSCNPFMSGVYSQENLTLILGLSSLLIISLAKPSKTQNLFPLSFSTLISLDSTISSSKYSTLKPAGSENKDSFNLGRYL